MYAHGNGDTLIKEKKMEAFAQKLIPLAYWTIGIVGVLIVVLIAVKVNKSRQYKPPK